MRIGLEIENGMDWYNDARKWMEEIKKRIGRELLDDETEYISMAIAFVITGWIGRFTDGDDINIEKLNKYIKEENERAIALIVVTFNLLLGVIAGIRPEEQIKKEMESKLIDITKRHKNV